MILVFTDVDSEEFLVRHNVSFRSALIKIKENQNALQGDELPTSLDVLRQEKRPHLEVIRKEQEMNTISRADFCRLISGLSNASSKRS